MHDQLNNACPECGRINPATCDQQMCPMQLTQRIRDVKRAVTCQAEGCGKYGVVFYRGRHLCPQHFSEEVNPVQKNKE